MALNICHRSGLVASSAKDVPMDLNPRQTVGPRVAKLVLKLLEKRNPAAITVDPAQDLREAGLTSLDMVNLMLAVEEEFDIFVPTDRMTVDNFRTIRAVEALVGALAPA